MLPLFDITTIKDRITPDTLLLTPNQRLSNKIRQAYDLDKMQHQQAWPSANIFSLETWITNTWLELLRRGCDSSQGLALLNSSQEKLVWQQTIEQLNWHSPILHPAATAELVQQAFKNCTLWNIAIQQAQFNETEESLFFKRCAEHFVQRTEKENFITLAQLPHILRQAFSNQELKQYPQIILVGFDDLAPQYQTLLNAASENIYEHAFSLNKPKQYSIAVTNPQQEIELAAQWCSNILQQNNNVRIGIIVENLAQNRQPIENIFVRTLQPQLLSTGLARYALPINFSAGTALDQAPIIQHALRHLKLISGKISFAEAISLLHSPFNKNNARETEISILAEYELRKQANAEISLAQLKHCLEVVEAKIEPNDENMYFGQRLLKLVSLMRENKLTSAKHLPSQWGPKIIELLEITGWPGARRVDSIEYQQIATWYEIINQLNQLDSILGPCNYRLYLNQLQRLSHESSFQAESADSPIQILGTLEAAGLSFTHLWMIGFNNKTWPPAASPNALIPIRIQIENNMPRASAGRELQIAQSINYKLTHSAEYVVASYYEYDGDIPHAASPLFREFKKIKANELPKYPIKPKSITTNKIKLEKIIDHQSNPINTLEPIKGGAYLIKNQAACPFRAFAIHRLNALALEQAQRGLSKQQRGILLHRSMEVIWNKLETSEALNSLTDTELENIITQSIEKSIHDIKQTNPDLGSQFWQLETERLQKQIQKWMQVEKERPPFTVLHREKKLRFKLSQLQLSLVIDRIDQADDNTILIDYKTGKCSPRQWESDRPDEPQLPLYVLALEQQDTLVDAISFAQINAQHCALNGMGQLKTEIKNVKNPAQNKFSQFPDWSFAKQHWQHQLSQLADEFSQGYAAVSPKTNQSCTYCHLQGLCRINQPENNPAEN